MNRIAIFEITLGVLLVMLLISLFNENRDKRNPDLRNVSYWAWISLSLLDAAGSALRWIFSTAPFRILAKIPGALWEIGVRGYNNIIDHMMEMGGMLLMISIVMEAVNRMIQLSNVAVRYAANTFTADPYARYVALLAILCFFYGHWRTEVRNK